MTQANTQAPVVKVKPQANIYTVLLFVAIVALAAAVGVVMFKLMSPVPEGYGLTMEHIFGPTPKP